MLSDSVPSLFDGQSVWSIELAVPVCLSVLCIHLCISLSIYPSYPLPLSVSIILVSMTNIYLSIYHLLFSPHPHFLSSSLMSQALL